MPIPRIVRRLVVCFFSALLSALISIAIASPAVAFCLPRGASGSFDWIPPMCRLCVCVGSAVLVIVLTLNLLRVFVCGLPPIGPCWTLGEPTDH